MADIVFKRTGKVNKNGSIPGILTIGTKSWPTIERGKRYTFVRQGEYTLKMDTKKTGRKVNCLRFDHQGVHTHLIHDALNDDHKNLSGCIAPGKEATDNGIVQSKEAMEEIFDALNQFKLGRKVTILVENNIHGHETKEEWLKRRQAEGKW